MTLVGCGAQTLSLASVQMEDTNQSKQPSLPTNYVSIIELKQRWLEAKEQKEKEQKEQKEKEREGAELRQRKLKKEEEKQRKLNAVVQVTDSKPRNRIIRTRFRAVNRRVSEPEGGAELEEKNNLGKKEQKEKEQQEEELRQRTLKEEKEKHRKLNAVVQVTDSKSRSGNIRTRFRVVDRRVSEPEGGAELEGKSEGQEEKKNLEKKKKKKKKKKKVRAENEEVVADKEGTVHAPPEASSEEKVNEAAIGKEERKGIRIQITANSENVGSAEEIGQKFGDLSVKGETEKGDGRLRRPSKVDKRGNGETGGYRRFRSTQTGVERVWVKKGEVDVDGVQSSKRSDAISGENALFV